MDDNDRIKVSDFGLSELLKEGYSRDEKETKGTPLYSAPEILLREPFDNKVDGAPNFN